MNRVPEAWQEPFVQRRCRLMAQSFARLVGRPLIDDPDPIDDRDRALRMYNHRAVLLSHRPDPDGEHVFCFANRQAQLLFKYDWDIFTRLNSKSSAEDDPAVQDDRSRLLTEAMRRGFVEHYSGIRRDAHGARFRIEDAVLWNVYDDEERYVGQAAIFDRWTPLSLA